MEKIDFRFQLACSGKLPIRESSILISFYSILSLRFFFIKNPLEIRTELIALSEQTSKLFAFYLVCYSRHRNVSFIPFIDKWAHSDCVRIHCIPLPNTAIHYTFRITGKVAKLIFQSFCWKIHLKFRMHKKEELLAIVYHRVIIPGLQCVMCTFTMFV